MKRIYFFASLLLASVTMFAQLPKIPKIPGGMVKDKVAEKAKEMAAKEFNKSRAEYDTTSFNYAVSLSDNAGLFENEERWQKNQKMFSDLKQIRDGQTPLEQASQRNDIGEMMYVSNKFRNAEAAFDDARRIYDNNSGTSEDGYGKVLANQALLHHTTGRYSRAEELSKQALEFRKAKSETSIGYAASVNNLGVLYKDMGRYSEAEKLLAQALQLNSVNPGKKSAGYAITLNNQAMLFEEMGRYDQAEKLLNESISIASEVMTEKSTNYQRLLINQALLYQQMGKYDQADGIYKKAIAIKERKLGTSHPDYAHLLNLQGELYMIMNKTSEVENLFKKSADIYQKKFGAEHPSYAAVLHNLGNYYRIQNNSNDAYTNLNKAYSIRLAALGEKHPDVLQTKESIALLDWQNNKIEEASAGFKAVLDQNIGLINEYFAPLSEAEKARFWDKINPQFQHYTAFVADVYEKKPELVSGLYDYQLTTKAMLLNSGTKIREQILNSGDAELIKEYKEWLDEKENLSRIYTMAKSEIKEQNINVDSIERVTNAREKKLSEKSNLFKTGYSISSITWKNIQAVLGAEDAAVEIVHLNKFVRVKTDTIQYAAIILTKETASPQMVVLKNGNQLEKRYFSYYRNSIKGKMADEYSYAQYWETIDKKLGVKKNIYVSLDGIYNQVNISTLAGADGKYLQDKKNFILLTNTKDIVKLKKKTVSSTAKNALLFGNPSFGAEGTVAALPGTKTEVENIKTQLTAKGYKVTSYVAAEATEQNIRKVANPKILHIATHGFFVKEATDKSEMTMGIESGRSAMNPMLRSGLLMANAEAAMKGQSETGILTAYEVMNLNLDQTEIVVVSACETGLGDVKNGEGVYGLQRAFLVAGVDVLIMSLWKVNDESTQKLMTSFYKNYVLLNDAQKAFKAAQNELKLTQKDPYFWGAFVMVN